MTLRLCSRIIMCNAMLPSAVLYFNIFTQTRNFNELCRHMAVLLTEKRFACNSSERKVSTNFLSSQSPVPPQPHATISKSVSIFNDAFGLMVMLNMKVNECAVPRGGRALKLLRNAVTRGLLTLIKCQAGSNVGMWQQKA